MLKRKYKKIYYLFNTKLKKKKKNDDGKTITYKIKFIDTCRFMQRKLSNLADNLSEINNKDCKKCMERKKLDENVNLLGLKIID